MKEVLEEHLQSAIAERNTDSDAIRLFQFTHIVVTMKNGQPHASYMRRSHSGSGAFEQALKHYDTEKTPYITLTIKGKKEEKQYGNFTE